MSGCPRYLFAQTSLALGFLLALPVAAQIRDGGIDPWNLGKGDWIYSMTDATNQVGGHIASVTNENSLMLFYKSQGIRYFIVKAGTGTALFTGCYNFPQFTKPLCDAAHANGLFIFGYNRSYATNTVGEVAVANYVFNQGADGFVWDAEAEWESSRIGGSGPALAWSQCSTVRSNWPNKFLAHAPFPIIALHNSFPYKEFGFWCDAVMPQIYHFSSSGLKGSPSADINWSDVNWRAWQKSLANSNSLVNGQMIYWTNSIKPIIPLQDVYGPIIPGGVICEGTANPHSDLDVMEFIDYCAADPHAQTVGGYKGINFWRTDLHGAAQWGYIQAAGSGNFPGFVNNIVIDDPRASVAGTWIPVKVFSATPNVASYVGSTGSDTNSFGTNYLLRGQGNGAAYVQFTPNVLIPGDYDVYQWHPYHIDASAATPFVINYNGGSAIVNANQRTNDGNWSLLGRFNFAAGMTGNVRVLDSIPEIGGVALADGVKLIFAGAIVAGPPPAAPGALNATTVSSNKINLTWSDNSTNEASFIVSRSSSSNGPFADIITLPANSTNCSNTNLNPGTTYYYVLRAYNVQGPSSNSAIVSATTLQAVLLPPAIDILPENQAVPLGQSAIFSVSASGTQPIAYQWRFNGNNLPGATSTSYTVPAASNALTGPYSVFVSNLVGSTSSPVALLTIVSLLSFGDNSLGQASLSSQATNVVALAAGAWHSLALQVSGKVVGWGNNANGQCLSPPGLSNAIAIAAGGYHNLAITADGSVAAWGANSYGQTALPAGVTNVIAVAAGTWHSLALRRDGTLVVWGDNSWGQTDLPPGLTNVTAIAAGGNHTVALKADGTVAAWGENTDGEGLYAGQSAVPPGLSNVIAIAAGSYHSLAVKADGTVVAWGDNSVGQCSVPPGLSGVIAVAGGGRHSLALKSDGSVVAWGDHGQGQCAFPNNLTNAVSISAGDSHSLALFDDGSFTPQLFSAAWSGNRFSAVAQTMNRKNYSLEAKTSIQATNWSAVSNVSGNGALKLLNDSGATSAQRFYRVRQW